MSHILSEPDSAFPTRSETKLAVSPLKMGLGFEISDLNRKQRDCTICSKSKGADQLRG